MTIFPLPRRLAVVPAVLALAATAFAPPAAAGPLERIQNTVDDFSCVFDTEEGATVYFFGSDHDFDSGSQAFVEGEDLYLEGGEGTAVFGTDTLNASVELETVPEGVPVATVSVSATTTLGEPTVEELNYRNGNTWTHGTVSTADYTFSDIVLTIDGFTPILADNTCYGQRQIFDVRSNDPAARVSSDSSLSSSRCPIVGMEDAELLLSGQLREPFVDIHLGVHEGDPRTAEGVLEHDGKSWSASLALIARATDEQVDTLDVTAQIRLDGAPYRERFSEGGFTDMKWIVPYTATFEILTDDGTTLTAQCEAYQVLRHENISPQLLAG